MNDETMRIAAEHRLLTAELVAVLAAPPRRQPANAVWTRWVAAALAIVGVLTVISVAVLRGRDTVLQDPPFDPLDPPHEHDWPMPPGLRFVAGREALDFLPASASAVALQPATEALLAAAADRRQVKWLGVWPAPNGPVLPLAKLAAARELESLMLGPPFAASELRELRHLPGLRRLGLIGADLEFDVGMGRAVAEAPFLRCLLLGWRPPSPEGIAALSGLPDLECLGVVLAPSERRDAAWLSELPRLRNLKALVLDNVELPPEFGQILGQLPRLRLFDISHEVCEDRLLAAIPTHIERLVLSDLQHATPEGVLTLRRCRNLRGLGFRGSWQSQHDAVCELVRRLPLERFETRVDVPTPALWGALQEQPRLRHLVLGQQGTGFQAVLEEIAKCMQLEVIDLTLTDCPTQEEVSALLPLTRLRRLALHIRHQGRGRNATLLDLVTVRSVFGGRVEVQVD